MKNQITEEQVKELINYRLKSIGLENYEGCISDVNDQIINWYVTILHRVKNRSK